MTTPNSDSSGNTKRPPSRHRKSTLTQQQKNKKRQRATPHQLSVLKSEFDINQTPNAKTREEIGRRIDMTERSVQIWFQNKRAKNKLLAKKQTTSFPQNYQFTMGGPYYHNPNMVAQISNGIHPHMSNATFPQTFVGNGIANFANVHFNPIFQNDTPVTSGSAGVHTFNMNPQGINLPCVSLSIGTWKRLFSATNQMPSDLQIVFSPVENMFSYTMYAHSTGFRIQYSGKNVKSIYFAPHPESNSKGEVTITLLQPPQFFIQTSKSPNWMICDDFSEMRQASMNLTHKLDGPSSELQTQFSRVKAYQSNKVALATSSVVGKTPMFVPGPGANTAIPIPTSFPFSMIHHPAMSEAPSPVTSNGQLQENIALGIAMSKTRSKSLPSLFGDESFGNDGIKFEPSSLSAETFSALNISVPPNLFFLNDDPHNTLSTMSTPEMDNLISNDQMTIITASGATSPSESVVDSSNHGVLASVNLHGLTHTPTSIGSPMSPDITSISILKESAISAADGALKFMSKQNMVEGSLSNPTADLTLVPSSIVGSTAVSPLAQSKRLISLGDYQIHAGDVDSIHASYNKTDLLFEGASVGASDMMIGEGSVEYKDDQEKLLMTTSANILDLEGATRGSESFPSSDFSGELDKVMENFNGDSSLLSLIQV